MHALLSRQTSEKSFCSNSKLNYVRVLKTEVKIEIENKLKITNEFEMKIEIGNGRCTGTSRRWMFSSPRATISKSVRHEAKNWIPFDNCDTIIRRWIWNHFKFESWKVEFSLEITLNCCGLNLKKTACRKKTGISSWNWLRALFPSRWPRGCAVYVHQHGDGRDGCGHPFLYVTRAPNWIQLNWILFNFIHFIHFYPILSNFIQFYSILFNFIQFNVLQVGTPFYMSPELFEEKPYRCAASRIRIVDDYHMISTWWFFIINRRDVRMFLRMEHSSNQN